MQLGYSAKQAAFWLRCAFDERTSPAKAGFQWAQRALAWITKSPYVAAGMYGHADADAKAKLRQIAANVIGSRSTADVLARHAPAPSGMRPYPFQLAGVEHMATQIERGRTSLLLADEQGLGKTVQAILLANLMGWRNILVVCPASLRLNWERELLAWSHPSLDGGVGVVLHGGHTVQIDRPLVTSYDLAECALGYAPDLLVVDEAHYVKSHDAKRTKLVLGRLVPQAHASLFLTGTPVPNRAHEFFPLLRAVAHDVIDNMGYWQFLRRFCVLDADGNVIGAQREAELYSRLRGSGFMTRRLKADVLKDLPPKTYKMVVFPANSATAKVLEKEKPFSATEIIQHGVPVGTALPEIRREMGVAKAPQAADYVVDLLEGGVRKVVVFAHHRDVIRILTDALASYRPVVITGATQPVQRQAAVDAFQDQHDVRVFVGQLQAAGTGWTLTRAHDVVLAEGSWVPGENDQAVDRLHRIGQAERVVVHVLVVEESLDAKILSAAARKATSIGTILDNQ